MGKKKILLVSNGFYPEISPRSFRATELALEFARQGHQVTVYTKYREFDYADFLEENNIRFNMWSKPRFPVVPVFKGKTGKLLTRALTRLFLMLFEYPGIEDMFKVKYALRKENGYDLLISFAVPFPVHWGVAWARTKKHRIAQTWVADCGDPYMGDTNDSFKKLFYFAYLEKLFLRKADFIAIPKIEMTANFYSQFHHKFVEIPQGIDLSKYRKLLVNYPKNKVSSFAFTGVFIKIKRSPTPLLEHLLQVQPDFRFYVFTKTPEYLTPYVELLGDKLIVRDYIPREELIRFLSGMDFLVNIGYNPGTQVPSKLIDYALTNRPVLNIDSNFKPEIVDEFLDGNYKHRFVVQDLEKYNISNVAQQFLELLPIMK